MAVLVTGGAGYIGSHVVLDLLDRGEDVVVLDNLSTGFSWLVPPAAKLVVGDIGDADLVRRTLADHAIDAVVHLTGAWDVAASTRNPLTFYCENACKTRSLVAAAVDHGIGAFIFASTSAVYGESGARPIREGDRIDPVSPYGRSKLAAEMIVRDAGEAHGLPYAILRFANAAGADGAMRAGESSPASTHLLKVACAALRSARPTVKLFGNGYPTPDGTCVRDYVHVSDLAEAHGVVLQWLRRGRSSITANLGSGRGRSVMEVLDAIGRVSGRLVDYTVCARRAGDPASVVLDVGRAREVLGWQPRRSLDDIVADALAWEGELRGRVAA